MRDAEVASSHQPICMTGYVMACYQGEMLQ
jgi:hypothetical protein